MNALTKGLGAIGAVVIVVLVFAIVLALSWAGAAVAIWLGLNVVAGLGLNFAQVVGLAIPVAYVAAGSVELGD